MTLDQERQAELDYTRQRLALAEGRLHAIQHADVLEAIESDPYVTTLPSGLYIKLMDGCEGVIAVTRREARVLAARLLRAASQ